jgi:hypothetical protein
LDVAALTGAVVVKLSVAVTGEEPMFTDVGETVQEDPGRVPPLHVRFTVPVNP